MNQTPNHQEIDAFINKWSASEGAETSYAQSFVLELCDLLRVPRPSSSSPDYQFERRVQETHTGRNRQKFIDLYKRNCFVWEAKQGSSKQFPAAQARYDLSELSLGDFPYYRRPRGQAVRGTGKWNQIMAAARHQADNYARAVSKEDGWPPFLLICDVGHLIEVYADFSGQGQGYTQFPDAQTHRIYLEDLRKASIRARLAQIWTDPNALNPAQQNEKVTRKIAGHLAKFGASFEAQGHDNRTVAQYLMRCVFTMFAQDVNLIPRHSFSNMLRAQRTKPERAAPKMQELWEKMNKGGFSIALDEPVKRFGGYLFQDTTALPLFKEQLDVLIEAAQANWHQVEPAIFGTLLERALDAKNRHKLGTHFTPRAYVERLVIPTLMDPLREEWEAVGTVIRAEMEAGHDDRALDLLDAFHERLCGIRVLDPACGSGNFLYVAMELMKRLEGEVLDIMQDLGGTPLLTVSPKQFLGIETNPWAAEVADLLIWIGYLQWQIRTSGQVDQDPILQDFKTIECRDALLSWQARSPRLDAQGRPLTHWDGSTTIRHQVTGRQVPDPQAHRTVYDYHQPSTASWPAADFILGNPPFMGNKRMRSVLGDGYVDALQTISPQTLHAADLVMHWWHRAATLVSKGRCRAFGFITTNSITSVFNRPVVHGFLGHPTSPLSLKFAIPDHPWIDATFGATVRIAMTCCDSSTGPGLARHLVKEEKSIHGDEGHRVHFRNDIGHINSNLEVGADLTQAKTLTSNQHLSYMGIAPVGMGFVLKQTEGEALRNTIKHSDKIVRPYMNGVDLIRQECTRFVIDFFGLSAQEARRQYPDLFQLVLNRVKPTRDQAKRTNHKKNWWLLGEQRPTMRRALNGLDHYITTVETTKHRVFTMLPGSVLPDQKLRVLASDRYDLLAILSSKFHILWAKAQGGMLGPTPVYNTTVCFQSFPFPELDLASQIQLNTLGAELDAHRKRQQAMHPGLTLTQMYNVLDALRAGRKICGKDHEIYERGLIGVLRDLHDQIDAVVAQAYGWPMVCEHDEILGNLLALNQRRAQEEKKQGHIRWLRPEYQTKGPINQDPQIRANLPTKAPDKPPSQIPWPKTLPEQIAATRRALEAVGDTDIKTLATAFRGASAQELDPLLQSLVVLGQAEALPGDRYAA